MRASAALLFLLFPAIARAQLACGNASVEARTVRYCSGGTGKPTVVLESGLQGTAATWDSVANRLLPFFRVISYDRPGHGGSPDTPTARTPADIATDLRRLLDQVGERDPVVLVAHAEGSWFVRAFALRYPGQVRAIVLIDPPHEDFEARTAALLNPGEQHRRDSTLASRAGAPETDAARLEADGIRQTPPSEWSRPLPDVPLYVLSAGRHQFAPAERAVELEGLWSELEAALAGRARQGRIQLVASGGPDLPRTHPDAIAGAIRDVVTRSEPQEDGGRPLDSWSRS